jgi:hypothetical protein
LRMILLILATGQNAGEDGKSNKAPVKRSFIKNLKIKSLKQRFINNAKHYFDFLTRFSCPILSLVSTYK